MEDKWCDEYIDLCGQDLQLITTIDVVRYQLQKIGIDIEEDVYI